MGGAQNPAHVAERRPAIDAVTNRLELRRRFRAPDHGPPVDAKRGHCTLPTGSEFEHCLGGRTISRCRFVSACQIVAWHIRPLLGMTAGYRVD